MPGSIPSMGTIGSTRTKKLLRSWSPTARAARHVANSPSGRNSVTRPGTRPAAVSAVTEAPIAMPPSLTNGRSCYASKTDTFEPGVCGCARIRYACHPSEEVDVFASREIVVNTDPMSEKTDTLPRYSRAGRLIENPECAALKRRQSGDDAEQGCLPCTIATEQSVTGTLGDGKRTVAQRGVIAVELPDVFKLDGGGHFQIRRIYFR
jgi:hypothetical protein